MVFFSQAKLAFLSVFKKQKSSPIWRGFDLIKKILKVDYPVGRAKGYFANFISAKKPKIEFSLFHPLVSLSTDIPALPADRSPGFRGENLEPLDIPIAIPDSRNYLIKQISPFFAD